MNKLMKKAMAFGLITIVFAGCSSADAENSTTDNDSATESAADETTDIESPAPETQEYSTELTPGNYTGGIDIPVGSYDLTLISGSGNIFCDSDAPINEIFGTDKDFNEIKSFNGVGVDQGDVLRTDGNLKIKAVSKKAQVKEMKPRKEDKSKAVTLSSGNYTAGDDFPAGTYIITATEGNGNVISTDKNNSDNDINLIMSPTPDSDMEETDTFNNATFDKGTTLELSSVTIQMIPVSD